MQWKELREPLVIVISILGIISAVFLAYGGIQEVNAVQDARILLLAQQIIDLKIDILRALTDLQYEIRELRQKD